MYFNKSTNQLLSIACCVLFWCSAGSADAQEQTINGISVSDLTSPFDSQLQARAVDSLIRSLGRDPRAYDALPISNHDIQRLFDRASKTTAIEGIEMEGMTPERRERFPKSRVIKSDLMVTRLAQIFLRAPNNEVLDFFTGKAMSLVMPNDILHFRPNVLYVGEEDCVLVLVYHNRIMDLLTKSEAVTIPMLLDSLSRIKSIERKSNRVAIAHVLVKRYKNASHLSDSAIEELLDRNLGVETPSTTLLSVIDEMRRIVSGEYEYMPMEKAVDRAIAEGLPCWRGENVELKSIPSDPAPENDS